MPDNYCEVTIEFDWANHPESANLHIWLPDDTFARMDAAIEKMPFKTREEFVTSAVLYVLSPEVLGVEE